MAGTLVIYKSKYGSAKQYAEWIAEACGADLVSSDHASAQMLGNYKSIVFGSGVYVGRMQGMDFITKNIALIEGKKTIIFSVSASPPNSKLSEEIFYSSIPAQIRGKIKYFHLRGRLGKLGLVDKILMLAPKSAAKAKYDKTRSEEDRIALNELDGFDHMDKKSIAPILAELAR